MKQLSLFAEQEIKETERYPKGSNVLISFSGGESSAFLLLRFISLNPHCNILVIFANTGDENEETYNFVNKLEKHYNVFVFWLEAYVSPVKNVGVYPVVVDYKTADREGTPLLDQSEKYGHCAIKAPHCNRDLKVAIIHKFAKEYFNGESYTTFQGIRHDEQTRINWKKAKEKNWDYPLARWGITKPYILQFWKEHKKRIGFRLELKEHEGNCNLCFKKSQRKLIKLIREKPCLILFRITLELVSKTDKHDQYRGNLTALDLLDLAKGETKESECSDFGSGCFCA